MAVLRVTAVSGNTVQVAFLVSQSFGGFTAPVLVTVDGARLFFPEERAAELATPLAQHWAEHRELISARA